MMTSFVNEHNSGVLIETYQHEINKVVFFRDLKELDHQALMAPRVTQGLPVFQVQEDQKVTEEILVPQALQDHLDHKEHRVTQDLLDLQEDWDFLVIKIKMIT